ncbi:MAG: hypothetical protein M1588_03825 [Planctomycetes bacterium]|jgi:hypothetical protein|nr:hypothetical protein [Planctomycetota bacterium]
MAEVFLNGFAGERIDVKIRAPCAAGYSFVHRGAPGWEFITGNPAAM